ncbi:hypothetical protein CHLRE_13g577550v5 [Chlamydomonas reinhardtii]|uniref:CCHC-type domain-containing protein n=1 Tax=Chlamydomonas reinhardtii TaxID=3055 RepID=A0A2K3D042_CHLRE|nr:uncharacterized protein CHLRE_13g577550v5 [Chlamydomonas reinhardtii]PNW73904.1 hypothetical protein CHLRE_13g577550v5 [Chlamydomonas reinhardtii]
MPRAAPRVVNNRDEDDDDEVESSASESEAEEEDLAAEDEAEDVGHDADEEEGEEQEEQEREEPRGGRAGGADGPASASGRGGVKQGGGRLKLSLAAGNDVCKVCGKRGHRAGFVGATYLDCPNKPCYLCKRPGHTTATCPYRIAPGQGGAAAGAAAGGLGGAGGGRGGRAGGSGGGGLARALMRRECQGGRHALAPRRPHVPQYQVEAAILKIHTRSSVCSLQLHRRGNKVVSVHVHPLQPALILTAGNDHSARIFDIRELSSAPSAAAAAAGGGSGATAANGGGGAAAAAAAAVAGARLATAGSAAAGGGLGSPAAQGRGSLSPSPSPAGASQAAEGKGKGGGKRGGATAAAAAAAAAANAVAARAELAVIAHPRVVNAAYFSPHTGRRILTTCQDNRLRVYDNVPYGCGGGAPPDVEIVHSHDFNRYLTPFKAEWDAKDPTESVFVVGRYISEDFGGVALHPVDVMSAADGGLLRQLTDTNLTTISPVNKPHPRRDVIISGSSRSLYCWAPVPPDDQQEEEGEAEGAGRQGAQAPGLAGRGGGSGSRSGGAGGAGLSTGAYGGGGAGGGARASRTFVSFDADPGGKAGAGAGGKKRKKGGGKEAAPDFDDDD